VEGGRGKGGEVEGVREGGGRGEGGEGGRRGKGGEGALRQPITTKYAVYH
jgi:hypothetical protein